MSHSHQPWTFPHGRETYWARRKRVCEVNVPDGEPTYGLNSNTKGNEEPNVSVQPVDVAALARWTIIGYL